MKRRRQVSQVRHDVEIELSPMIDCIFILLIFFIVTSVFVEDPGVEVEKPNVSGIEAIDRQALLVAISAENRIFFEGRELRIEQVAPQLHEALYDAETPVIIRADRRSDHGVFAAVYSEAKKAGIRHVQFATQKGGLTP